MRIAVIGGGIAGLAAAWAVRDHHVTVLEASGRVGGKLRTGEVDGVQVEFGADAFLAEPSDAVTLAQEVGLAADLVAPASSGVSIWRGRALHRLPEGVVFGAPTQLRPLLRSGLLSPAGVARAGFDLLLPPTGGITVADVVGRRFGREVVERLLDPLLGGVYAGDPHRLDAAAATPLIAEAANAHRSLLTGLRRRRRGTGPAFRTVVGGLDRLPAALEARLDVRVDWPVAAIEPAWGGRWTIHGPASLEVDAVVVATPAYVSADLLRDVAPTAAAALSEIAYASVALVALVYDDVRSAPPGSGMLVPSSEGRTVKAATWMSSKWPHLGDGRLLVRASSGRHGDDRSLQLGDDTLVAAVGGDLHDAVGLPAEPDAAVVIRWERALPQYEPGHLDRVTAIEASLPAGIGVAGAAYRGIGIPACIRQGRDAALTLTRTPPRA